MHSPLLTAREAAALLQINFDPLSGGSAGRFSCGESGADGPVPVG